MSLSSGESTAGLLSSDDPPPVEIFNADAAAPLLVVCDHASRLVPRCLGGLGLAAEALERHIAWDIGAAEVARRLASRFDAPLVMSGYSRLVIDVNRRPDDPTAIPEESDGTPVPGNRNLSPAARSARLTELFEPYHRAIEQQLAVFDIRGVIPMVISVHSFTPVFNGFTRPWHVGVLWNRDDRLPRPLMARLGTIAGAVVGDNEPYSGQDGHGYTMPRHVEGAGIPHALIEIRQNLIDTRSGVDEWAEKLYGALAPLVADPMLRQKCR